jgi:hypothetical protein
VGPGGQTRPGWSQGQPRALTCHGGAPERAHEAARTRVGVTAGDKGARLRAPTGREPHAQQEPGTARKLTRDTAGRRKAAGGGAAESGGGG